MTMYEKYCRLDIDGKWIGLEKNVLNMEYFCTPVGAEIIGWENCIHYCFIRGYRDMVFAVNPEACVGKYVYPLAMNFRDFLRLIISCGSTTAIEQIISWSKKQFESFLVSEDNAVLPEQQKVLDTLRNGLKLKPMEEPYEYVKSVQAQYGNCHSEVKYSNEYYDTLGLQRPDGTKPHIKPVEFSTVTFSVAKKDK